MLTGRFVTVSSLAASFFASLLFATSLCAPAAAETPIERGSYLVNTVMTCQNCHTPKGPAGDVTEKAFSGGLSWDEPPFKVTASNITQDKVTGIGNWTAAQLKSFLLSGVRPNGVPVAPLMPTGYYKILVPSDLDAIVAYLRTIKPIKNEVAEPEYRAPMAQEVFPGAEKPANPASLNDKTKRGFYLATIAHCMECHTPMDKGQHLFATSLGKGGQDFPGPWGKSVSRNITSDKVAGIGGWTDAEIKRAITQGIAKDGTRLKPPMGYGYYAKMTGDDLDAIVAWLRTVPPKS
jgi:mono/diheme cytochrome c family protein